MVSTPVLLSFLLNPCPVLLSCTLALYPCSVPLSFLLSPCHSEERSDEESAVLVWFLQEAEVSSYPCHSEERSDEESAVFLGLLRISRFARNDKQQGLFEELDFAHHLYETKTIREAGCRQLPTFTDHRPDPGTMSSAEAPRHRREPCFAHL